MKKTLRYADCLVLLAAIIGCLLQLWFQTSGVDANGLYRTSHPAWILLCLLSVGVIVFLWFLSRSAGDNQCYNDNFKRSIISAGSYLLLAVGLGYVGITEWVAADELLEGVVAFGAMVAAVMLGVTGAERFSGNRPVFFLHMIPCFYFALRMFLIGRELGTEPELCKFLFRFAASVCMIPAFYWLWGFDVDMANRQRSLFWSLSAAFFCLVTTFETSQEWWLYLLYAAFLLCNLCKLQHIAQPEEVSAEKEAEHSEEKPADVEEQEEIAVEEKQEEFAGVEDLQMKPAPELRQRPVLHADIDPETDMDAFLADIKQFLESEQDA